MTSIYSSDIIINIVTEIHVVPNEIHTVLIIFIWNSSRRVKLYNYYIWMNRWDEVVRSSIDLLSPEEPGSLLVLKSQTTKAQLKRGFSNKNETVGIHHLYYIQIYLKRNFDKI